MDLQTNREVAAQEDLLQKADLNLNLTESRHKNLKHVIQSVDVEFEAAKKPVETETEKKNSEAESESSQSYSDSNQTGATSISRRAQDLAEAQQRIQE